MRESTLSRGIILSDKFRYSARGKHISSNQNITSRGAWEGGKHYHGSFVHAILLSPSGRSEVDAD
ncbi:MAG: hypothetical protein KBS44_04240, partial [Clostridiales bacterium]|nr:hypothetical protein [Candidatus Coliplasma equi]